MESVVALPHTRFSSSPRKLSDVHPGASLELMKPRPVRASRNRSPWVVSTHTVMGSATVALKGAVVEST